MVQVLLACVYDGALVRGNGRCPPLRLQVVRVIPLLVIHGPGVVGPHAVLLSRSLQTPRPSSRASDGDQFPLGSRVWILARLRRLVGHGLRLLQLITAPAGPLRVLPLGLLSLAFGFLGALGGLSLLRQSFGLPRSSGISRLARLDGGGSHSTVSHGKLRRSPHADVRWVFNEAPFRS